MRDVKLGATIEHLIEEQGLRRNRQRICTAVGITPAALSQYINQQTKPSLDKLVALADFFQVTLDYLVFGETQITTQQATVDYGPLARYVDTSLANVQRQIAAQSALVGRIGSILASKLTETAEALANDANPFAGMISDDQTLELEMFSKSTTICSMNLNYDVLEFDGQPTAGRFLPVVAQNLSRGRTYRFLLPPDVTDWRSVVGAFRTILGKIIDHSIIRRNCSFGVAKEPLYVGFGIYELDLGLLKMDAPVLFEYIRDYISDDDRIGYVIGASPHQQGDSLMDRLHLDLAQNTAQRLWRNIERL